MRDDVEKEQARLNVLHALDLLDVVHDENFDQITRLASFCFDMPVVLISLVDRDRQQFLSRVGTDLTGTPRDVSICAHAIRQRGLFEVADLTTDTRFSSNPLVVDSPGIQFYAGAPLVTESGHAIGTLCLIDFRPRSLTPTERTHLLALAQMVMTQVALRQVVGHRDAVSGLPNRQQFVRHLQALPALYPGEDRLLVLIEVMDLARAIDMGQALSIKAVETLIYEVGVNVSNHLAGIATLYHVGTSRYAFVMADDGATDQHAFLTELIAVASRTLIIESVPLRPDAHLGLVELRLEEGGVGDALRQAMSAVTASLKENRPWTWYDADRDARFRRNFRLAVDMPQALAEHQLYLVYQPRVDLTLGRVTAVEALLRWTHPDLGEIGPAEFIPVVERTALMQPLTLWVVDAALAQLSRWSSACPDLRVSVNLSARDFDGDALPQALRDACARHGIAPDRLEVEVTEGEWLYRSASVARQLADMVADGVNLAIDDFGTGYSNFGYLSDIPARIIKLDQSLVRHLPDTLRDQRITRAILDLARDLGYRTVAEGVEDARTLRLLQDWRCDEAQGYYLSRPIPASDVDAFVRDYQGKP
ncbi:EAL domain-containing protein [Pigmentiphaga litoralis]|uniref:sensor domain-containing phosphodiesterase n=1 Tax=Pigmentiphaga litoralis TaxID=516702 RepID=UPI003B4366E7